MRRVVGTGVVVNVLLAFALPAFASFQAAELLYLPVAAHNSGVEGSLWRTDLTITNVDDTAVDVCIFFFPNGAYDNSAYLARTYGLGGRSEEGWAHLNEALADIPSQGTVVLPDVVNTWLEQLQAGTALGAMAIFAYEAGTLDATAGPVYRNVIAHSRTYNETTIWVPDAEHEGEFLEQAASYGQSILGVPWYDLADPSYVSEQGDFSFYVLTGGVEDETYRYNVGLFNASDSQTGLNLEIQPFKADGTIFTDDEDQPLAYLVTMPPLSQIQYNRILTNVFNLEDVTGVSLKITFLTWSTTSTDPNPAFAAYGSVVDNRSSDPTTVLPAFGFPYNIECMWPPSKADGGGQPMTGGRRRPLDVPRN